MKIAIYPYQPNLPNKYIDRMVEAMKIAYPNAQITSYPSTKNLISLKGYDYVWLNWFENLSSHNKFRQFISKLINLIILKFLRIKIITTLHNRQPHEATKSILDKLIYTITFKFSSKIIILSFDSNAILTNKFGKSILKKVVLIPHPTYDCKPKESNNLGDKFSILFFGHLRPYKNIELILEVAKIYPEIPFTIAGSPIDKEYEKELKCHADNIKNVNLIPRFITDSEIDELIDKHCILLLPYDLKSSLNSGVVIHAICKRINMIVPTIGTVNQLQNKHNIFTYTYESYEDHYLKLIQKIYYANNEYENNRAYFEERIKQLHEEAISNQSPKMLSNLITEVFK